MLEPSRGACAMRRSSVTGGLSVLLPLLWASAALGQPSPAASEPLQLEWQGEPSCGDAATVRAGALELLGGTTPRRRLAARATLQREGRGWQVHLETDSEGERGTRELRGESCAAVQRAVSLMLAMILESEPPAPPGVAPAAPVSPAPPPAVAPAAGVIDAPAREARSPERGVGIRWLLAPELSGGVGATPKSGIALGASAGLVLARFELGVAGRYWFPREQLAPIDDPARPGHRVGRQELEAYGCYAIVRAARSELALSGCMAPGVTRHGADVVRASGGPDTVASWSPHLSGSLRLRYYPTANFFAGLQPAATWSKREEFELGLRRTDGGGAGQLITQPVYTTRDVFFRLSLEMGLRF